MWSLAGPSEIAIVATNVAKTHTDARVTASYLCARSTIIFDACCFGSNDIALRRSGFIDGFDA
jgi:hypothetical protein